MIKCCVLFSLLIPANSMSLFVYCVLAGVVGLFASVLCIMTILMANLCFILALICRSHEQQWWNRYPFNLRFEYHNFLTTISTSVVKNVFEKSLNCSFFCIASVYRLYLCIPFSEDTLLLPLARIKNPVIK